MTPKQGVVFAGILLLIAEIIALVCIYKNAYSLQMQKITILIVIISIIFNVLSARKNMIDKKREKEAERMRNVFGMDDTINYN